MDSNIKAEEEVLEDAKRMLIWEKLHLDNWKQAINKVNMYLSEKTEEAYEKIVGLVKSEEVLKNYLMTSEFAYMVVVISIYEEEKSAGIKKTIFTSSESVEELINYIAKIKFWIWRLEFEERKEDLEDFNVFIEKEDVSPIAVHFMLRIAAFDKVKASFLVALSYRKKRKDVEALRMLLYANTLENDELIICEIADIYVGIGKIEEAMNIVKMIEKPTEHIEKYMDKWEKKYAR